MALSNFVEDVQSKVNEYLDGEQANVGLLKMLTELAIECFKDAKNYPLSYTDEQIEKDLRKHISRIAYGVVEFYGKVGVEGHKSFSENGITRTYREGFISSYSDVIPFINVR